MSQTLTATLKTSKGDIQLQLFPEQAPMTVANFVNLARRGYYDGLNFHRVIADFMIQGGCPEGSGRGGPGYQFDDECTTERRHDKPGVLSMANAGPGTNGSQFFITHVATPWLDGRHTVYGAILADSDLDIVNAIQQGDTLESISIEGDTSALLDAADEQIGEWNKILDKRFPDLRPAG